MDQRRHAPAAERNREPILAVLRRVLPERGTVLEIASGTGQHAAHFGAALPALTWQPSERDVESFPSIVAWARHSRASNLHDPLLLDVLDDPWPIREADAIFNANLIHISPWEACLGLLRGAGKVLSKGGLLILYGPYRIDGRHTAPSNAAFDAELRARDPAWGVRDLEDVAEAADARGLVLEERVPMPANNQILLLRRA